MPYTKPGIDSAAFNFAKFFEHISIGAAINNRYPNKEDKRVKVIDCYVIGKCILAVVLLFTPISEIENTILRVVLTFAVIYSGAETVLTLFLKILYPEPGNKPSYRRASLLLFINWLDLILLYAILYYFSGSIAFTNHSPVKFDYFYFSFLHGTTMDMNGAYVRDIGRIISIFQVTTFVIFITLFFSHNFGKLDQ